MGRIYLRRTGSVRDTLGALATSVGVGAVVFYFVRMLLAREGVETESPRALERRARDRDS